MYLNTNKIKHVHSLIIYISFVFWIFQTVNTAKLSKKKYYSIRGTRLICKDVNTKFIQNITCSSKPSRNDEIINGSGTLHPNVTLLTVHWHIKLFAKYGTIYRPLLLDTSVDFCALYRGLQQYEFLPELKLDAESENIHLGCPVSGTRYVRNLRLRKDLYPSMMPEGDFRLENRIYTLDNGDSETILNSVMWFAVSHNDSARF